MDPLNPQTPIQPEPQLPIRSRISPKTVVLVIVAVLIIFGTHAYWSGKNQICIQVTQSARNIFTGEIKTFSTPCDVPLWWKYVNPEPEPATSIWQTYRNTAAGFEFNYPADKFLLNPTHEDTSSSLEVVLEPKNGSNLAIIVEPIADINSQEIFTTANINRDIREELAIDKLEVRLGTRVQVDFEGDSPYGYRKVYIQIPGTSTGLLISGRTENTDLPEYGGNKSNISLYKQILSTFKFVEKGDTSTWKTYVNETYGYSVEYPSTWYVYDKGIYGGQEYYSNPKKSVLISPTYIKEVPEGDPEFKGVFGVYVNTYGFSRETFERPWNKLREVTVAGVSCLEAVVVKETMGESGLVSDPHSSYFCEKSGNTFWITFDNYDLEGSHDKIFDQILSTLRFTK